MANSRDECDSARYCDEQGLEEMLTAAVNRVIAERAPNAALRLAELLGGGARAGAGAATHARGADLEAELAEARAKLAEQDEQLAEATERFEVLKEELGKAVARLPKEGSFRRKGEGSFKRQANGSFKGGGGSFSRSKATAGQLTPREKCASSLLDAALSAGGPLNAGSDSDSDSF